MAASAQNRKSASIETKRAVIHVPLNVCSLLDLIASYRNCTKAELHEVIWRAGCASLLGLHDDDYEEAQARTLPRGTQPPTTIKALAEKLLA